MDENQSTNEANGSDVPSAAGTSKDADIENSNGAAESANKNLLDFPVVGIGTSAGGLEALESFFQGMPAEPGAAFVIVQHLSPNHQSFMEELLARYTEMPVEFVVDGTPVAINHVYLIPPKVNIVLRGGALYQEQIVGRGLNLPIDIFFRSLAKDQRSNAVAIILSGAGSDGTLGIRAIKELGGIAMVQEARDAKFDGMPKSALATNMIDLMRPANELAKELVSFLAHPLFTHPGETVSLEDENKKQYNRVLAVLKAEKKVDFASYRQETIVRRLEKRISINRFDNLADYADFLVKTPNEIDTLFHEILIGVTRFFRDAEAFETLEKSCLPALFEKVRKNGELRIWVGSCSTGEEVYSVAILIKDYMLNHRIHADVKIFATDLDERSLKFAAVGFYPQNVTSDIPPQFLAKYFSPHGSGYQINADIRRMIIFAPQNLIENPPFFKLDLICCRNFLIYICSEAQQRVLSSFYVGLKTDGFLFLGSSESLGKLSEGFAVVDAKSKIFRKLDGYTPDYSPKSPMPLHLSMLERPKRAACSGSGQENGELLAVLEQIGGLFLQPSLILDDQFQIIYTIHGGGDFLPRTSGRVTTNLLKILPKDVSLVVSSLLRRSDGREAVISADIVLNERPTNVKCKHIVLDRGASYYYLIFEEPAERKSAVPNLTVDASDLSQSYQERIDELEQEILDHKESLKVAVEQLETSNEELQASNEELQASNEELQSSNEELQSVNEELYTVNIEHVRKLEEITQLTYDYDNLLSNTQIGTLFLDSDLIIRKISRQASKITGILQTDIGRPLSCFSLSSLYPEFMKDVERVNASKNPQERELLLQGKSYFMRIVPYFAEENVIKGIIISFVDLTECKMRAIEEVYSNQVKIRTSSAQLEAATEMVSLAYFQINMQTRECSGSKLFPSLCPLRGGLAPLPEEWVYPADLDNVNACFDSLVGGSRESALINFRTAYFGDMRYYRMALSKDLNSAGDHILNGVMQDVTHVIRDQQRLEAKERFWEESINAIPVLFYAKDADDDFRYVFANRYFLDFTGKRIDEIIGKTDEEITPTGGKYRAEDELAVQSEDARSFENEAVAGNGAVRYFHTIKRRDVGADGRRLLMGIGSDVTQQRQMIRDLQIANNCMTAYFEADDADSAICQMMGTLCGHLGASHCFLMSFDYGTMTTRCEEEYVAPGKGKALFGSSEPMPFSIYDDWYISYLKNKILDIPDIVTDREASSLLGKYCGFPYKLNVKSLYAIGFRNRNTVDGAVGFVYSDRRPEISAERLSYLMSFASYLFKNVLLRKKEQNKEREK